MKGLNSSIKQSPKQDYVISRLNVRKDSDEGHKYERLKWFRIVYTY